MLVVFQLLITITMQRILNNKITAANSELWATKQIMLIKSRTQGRVASLKVDTICLQPTWSPEHLRYLSRMELVSIRHWGPGSHGRINWLLRQHLIRGKMCWCQMSMTRRGRLCRRLRERIGDLIEWIMDWRLINRNYRSLFLMKECCRHRMTRTR